MSCPRTNGRRSGSRCLTALAARLLADGRVSAWCRVAWVWPGQATGRSAAKRVPRALIRFAGAWHAAAKGCRATDRVKFPRLTRAGPSSHEVCPAHLRDAGNAWPCGRGDGDGGVGLHGQEWDARLRGGRDGADGAGAARRAWRGQRDADALQGVGSAGRVRHGDGAQCRFTW